jgi:hypothetical protein
MGPSFHTVCSKYGETIYTDSHDKLKLAGLSTLSLLLGVATTGVMGIKATMVKQLLGQSSA